MESKGRNLSTARQPSRLATIPVQLRASRVAAGIALLAYTLLLSAGQAGARLRLASADLAGLSFEEIHALAVDDQLERQPVAQKSLHTRPTSSLDGFHDFCLDELAAGFGERWHAHALRDKCRPENLYRMPVPAAFNELASNSSVRNYAGWFWYQTSFSSLTDLAERLQFESVNYLAIVWLQRLDSTGSEESVLLGSHVGGHLPFSFPVPRNHLSGSSATFRLTVAASNRLTSETIPSGETVDLSSLLGHYYQQLRPDFDFFHFAGITGSVSLVRLARLHIERAEQVRQAELSELAFEVQLAGPDGGSYTLETRLLAPDGSVARSIQTNGSTAGGHARELVRFSSAGLLAWRLAEGRPNHLAALYTARFELRWSHYPFADNPRQRALSDRYELRVGLRSAVQIDARRGLLVQGRTQQLQGFGMHHEQQFAGRSMSRSAILKDVYLLKQLGANVVRTSHYPYSSAFLDACDEHGIAVIGECAAVGLRSFGSRKLLLHGQLLREMMRRDQQHPSIVMWSVANEPQSQREEATDYFEALLAMSRTELAPYTVQAGRPLTAAIAQEAAVDRVAHTLDVLMFNSYFGWYQHLGLVGAVRSRLLESLEAWARKHPNKPLLQSEFGAEAVAGLHRASADAFSEEYQRELIREHELLFDQLAANRSSINFWGSMIWNFADFSTHDSLWRVAGNRKGIFTKDREPKLAVSTVRELYLGRLRASQCQADSCNLELPGLHSSCYLVK